MIRRWAGAGEIYQETDIYFYSENEDEHDKKPVSYSRERILRH